MTELEEYLAYRRRLKAFIDGQKRIAADAAESEAARRTARLKTKLFLPMLEDVDIQIQALDPTALPKRKRAVRASTLSLDRKISDKSELYEVLTAPKREEPEEPEDETTERRKRILAEAAVRLTPRQAEALNLRYNSGLTLQRVAEEMHISVRAASLKVRRAEAILEHWASLRSAAEACAISGDAFDFEQFLTLEPAAFSKKCREIVTELYNAPISRYRTIRSLAAALGRDADGVSRDVAKIKALCLTYGISEAALHPLVQKNRRKGYNAGMVFQRYGIFAHERTCRRTVTAEDAYRMRSDEIRFRTVEDAVLGKLQSEYGLSDGAFVREAVELFDGDRLCAARERIDEGKTLKECRTAKACRKTLTLVRTAALYAYFKSDVRRIFRDGNGWPELLQRWRCFPPGVEAALRVLWEHSEIATTAELAKARGITHAAAGEAVRSLGFYCRWWGIPDGALPELAKKYLNARPRQRRNAYAFRRAVNMRHEPRKEASENADTQGIEGRAGQHSDCPGRKHGNGERELSNVGNGGVRA